jgi:hypothetical protein
MGHIQEWGKPRPPIPENTLKLLRGFGWKYNEKGIKQGEDNHNHRPPKITYILKDTKGDIKRLPNLSSDYCTMFHNLVDRGMGIADESLAEAPFPEELPKQNTKTKVKTKRKSKK